MRKFNLLILALVSFILFAIFPQENAAWVINPANNHLYTVVRGMSWWIVEAEAIGYGGHLAAINSRNEQLWLKKQFGTGLWIGLNDMSLEGKWEWVNGEPVTYTNWCYREPNDGKGNLYIRENVARMGYPDSYLDCWFDVSGKKTNRGIIEISNPEAIANIIQENFNAAISSYNEEYITEWMLWALSGYVQEPERSRQINKAREVLSSLQHSPKIYIIAGYPVTLFVTDPKGRSIGRDAKGNTVNEIPGSRYSNPNFIHQKILIPRQLQGNYNIVLHGIETGPFHLSILEMGSGNKIIIERIAGNIKAANAINYTFELGYDYSLVKQIDNLIDFFDEAVGKKLLKGKAQEKSRKHFLKILKEKIATAGSFIEEERYDWASRELLNAYERADGLPNPPDFVEGDAALTLASKIQNLRINLKNQ